MPGGLPMSILVLMEKKALRYNEFWKYKYKVYIAFGPKVQPKSFGPNQSIVKDQKCFMFHFCSLIHISCQISLKSHRPSGGVRGLLLYHLLWHFSWPLGYLLYDKVSHPTFTRLDLFYKIMSARKTCISGEIEKFRKPQPPQLWQHSKKNEEFVARSIPIQQPRLVTP